MNREFLLVRFYRGRRVIASYHRAGVRSSVMLPHARLIALAFKYEATRIVLHHNHPSGNPQPSAADIKSTALLRGLLEGRCRVHHWVHAAGKRCSC